MSLRVVIGQYYPADSVVHRLDPRIKLTLLLAWFALAFVADSLAGLGLLLALLFVTMLASRIPARVQLKALAPLLFLLLFPLIFNILFITTGDVLASVGPLTISSDGVYRAIFMTLRLLLLFSTAVLLTLSTSAIALCDALASMLAPFRRFGLPAFEIAMMAAIAMRFLPVLTQTYEHIRRAHLARGSKLGQGAPLARLRALAPVLVALLAQSFRMAEELANAMESRCYNGAERTHYHVLAIRRRDVISLIIMLIILGILVALRFYVNVGY
ncbi:MAG: energy-coupling factor transporter transmembrane protein EcfT [Coriobacteriales bacterium]|jgi:energy-coupling factor transport system permease protein|nr:energy-coupling factor transporter transmembrane protein EcfT [Coriobacteriales bacterium]